MADFEKSKQSSFHIGKGLVQEVPTIEIVWIMSYSNLNKGRGGIKSRTFFKMLWLCERFSGLTCWIGSFRHSSSLLWYEYLKGEVTYIFFVCLNVKDFSKAGFSCTTMNLFSHLAGIVWPKLDTFIWKHSGEGEAKKEREGENSPLVVFKYKICDCILIPGNLISFLLLPYLKQFTSSKTLLKIVFVLQII